jgi:hypothetical protein
MTTIPIPRPLALLLTLTIGGAAIAAPRDEALRLVPDEMSFCVVVQGVRERAKAVGADSFVSRVAAMPFLKAKLDSPEFKKLLDVEQYLLKELQITPEQLRDELLGDAVVFAYRQGPSGKPEQEQGLFLIHAHDAELLVKVVERLNQFQKKTGELKELRTERHRDQEYIRRVKGKGQPESEFYFIHGNLIAFSQQESAIKAALDREHTAPPAAKETPEWARLQARLGLEKALAALLVNPRRFDAEIAVQEDAAKGPERSFLREFRKYWRACDGLGLYLDLDAHGELGLAITARADALPKAARQFFVEAGKPSELWKVIPDDALFALAARTDPSLLAEMLSEFGGETGLKEVRAAAEAGLRPFLPAKGGLDALLKGLGPDWGLWVAPPAATDKTWVPQTVLALKVRKSDDGAAAETTVSNAVQFLFVAAQFGSKTPMRVETIKQDGLEIKALSNDALFPAGFRPSFAVKEGYILFAGSPEAIKRFAVPEKAPVPADEAPLLRVSAAAWRLYLTEHKDALAEFLGKMNGVPAKDVAAQIEAVAANLGPFDRLEIVVKSKPDLATIIVRIKTAKPTP